MKALKTALIIALMSAGCSHNPMTERLVVMAPARSAIAGVYAIYEETVTGLPLAQSGVTTARLQIREDGTGAFLEFPLFVGLRASQRDPRKVTEELRWSINPRGENFELFLTSLTVTGFGALIIEGGYPQDLLIIYGPKNDPVGFSKWRKVGF